MSGREPSRAFQASKRVSGPAPLPSSRRLGLSQVYLLFVLVLGFLLFFPYQYEIHSLFAGRDWYAQISANDSSESLRKPSREVPHSDAKVETTDISVAREDTEVLEVLSSGNGIHSTLTQRKLEWEPTTSSEQTTQEDGPRPAAEKKPEISWKDHKIEEYIPLVESVQSNVISAKFQLLIKVLALNNYSSLVRCLSSLSKADYAGDSVDIHIYIDHFEVTEVPPSSQRRLLTAVVEAELKSSNDGLDENRGIEKTPQSKTDAEQSQLMEDRTELRKTSRTSRISRKLADENPDFSEEPALPDRVETGTDSVKQSDWELVEQRLTDARKVLDHAESFQWKHGKKLIHYRTRTAGSQSQWLDAWWPSSDDEFAFFVEDDVEVSPLYYRYVRSLIATYYYQWDHFDHSLYGISLQRPQIVPGKNGRALGVDDRTRLFKYQMVGIWGQIFFPRPWKEFRLWYDTKKSHAVKPIVDGMVTTDWYREFGEKIFTPWFVKFAYNRGYYNMYTNFLRDRVLSVVHRDLGPKSKNYAGCDSVLIYQNGTYDIDLWHMAANWNIKRYDYCFREVRVGRFANYSHDASWVVGSAQDDKKILVVSTVGVPDLLVRNWLCNLRKLGIENYLLVGEDPVLLEDLARRGHASMRIENNAKFEEDIEKEVSAVLDVLKLGYDVWFTRADTIWIGNPLALSDTEGADVVGVDNSKLNLFFIRSTDETIQLWGSLSRELSQVPANISRLENWERAREKFLKGCHKEEKVTMRTPQQVVFIDGEKLERLPSPESSEGSTVAQLVVLSGLRSSDNFEIKAKVGQLNSWNLNEDHACAELAC